MRNYYGHKPVTIDHVLLACIVGFLIGCSSIFMSFIFTLVLFIGIVLIGLKILEDPRKTIDE